MTESRRIRVVAIANHPIQYHAPLFRALSERAELDFAVGFAEIPDSQRQGRGFGVAFQWDVPLREGYRWNVLRTRRLALAHLARWMPTPRAQLRALHADVLLLTGWQSLPLLQALLAAGGAQLPMLLRAESSGMKKRRGIVRSYHRALLRRIDAFLAIGTANRAFYEAYGIAPSRIFDAPYFVDNARFSSEADRLRPQRPRLRAEFGVPHDAICFLFAGKLEPKKHPEHLLDALAHLGDRRVASGIHALFVGEGPLGGQLRETARRHALPATFAGFLNQTEIAKAYVAADALVLPSDYGETWGLVVNEAMACGIPALVSDRVGCGPDLVLPGVTGERYRFGDIDRMAAILQGWAEAAPQLVALGHAARERVLRDYTVDRSATAVVEASRAVFELAHHISEGPRSGHPGD